MSVRLSPVLAGLGTYPFVRLEEARARLRAAGVELIDFGMGEPREETPEFIREALADAITPLAPYPSAVGLPELREAIAGWAGRRFGVSLDPDTEVIPTLGSKEAVFALAHVFDGELVVVPHARVSRSTSAARVFAGKEVVELPLREENGWLPDLDGVDWDARRGPVAQLPEQPDRRDGRRGRVLRAGRRAGAQSTASCWPPTRRTRSSTSAASRAGLRAAGRRSLATSPCSTRCPSARRCPATAPGSSPATRRSSPR